MSDSIEDLLKQYEENVLGEEYSRSVGLFPIPEYPEWEERGMWSTALDAILTTLRYLAPATLLTLFWGQQSFLFKLLKHIDSAFRAIFSSDEQKQAVLRWLAEVGPVRVEHLDTVWRHGWILCGVLDGALPGACAGHPPARLSLKHAQAIADHYLGVEPVFSRQELESCDSLSRHQEWKLATYLDRIRLALAKLTPPVSRPTSQRTSPDNKPENTQVTLDYVARGSGLAAAQVNNKAYFKVYPTAQQSVDPGEINVLIRGPKDSYGMLILPPILGKAQLFRQKLLGLEPKLNFTENALPITQGATYLRNYGKNDMNKTYFIPKTNNDIDIEVETKDDHARVGYTVNCLGKYEIAITSRGQSIVGSPFKVTASNDIVGVLAKESFCLEDGEEIDIVDVKTDRKVVLRIVDFVTEKMLLRENGCLEKITEDEAKFLLHNDNVDISHFKSKLHKPKAHEQRKLKFIIAVNKVIKMNRVCNMFNDLKNKTILSSHKQATSMLPKSQQDIPDIVNSTFSETNMHAFLIPEKQNRVIIPENISVSLMTEKPKQYQDDNQSLNESESNTDIIFQSPDYLEKYKILCDPFEDEDLSIETTQSSNNPFINDMYTESYKIEKKLGAFLATEYETNNSQGEVIEESLKKFRENQLEESLESACNPFVDLNVASHRRPKSPVFKIISGQTTKRAESLFIDSQRQDTIEEILGNEFINPFFTHHHESNQYEEALPVTDFIIGAPVSLPPILRAGSPEPHIDSIVLSADSGILDSKNENQNLQIEHRASTLVPKLQSEINSSGHSSSHTMSSNDFYDSKVGSNIPLPGISPKKETWDSAYVSIDDNSSSPDSNNNDNSLSEPLIKQPSPPSDELSTMGPAEKEIWETCSELKENVSTYKVHEDTKISKRPTFTPIIEENEKSLNIDMKDSVNETDPVTAAFCELNEIFENYFPQSENSTIVTGNNLSRNLENEYMVEKNDISVDSASEELSDVKRHVRELEGMISEVQGSVTESDSASRILRVHNDSKQHKEENKDETKFGGHNHSNIVLERKKYWDEKIRLIQAKTDEMKAQQKKRRVYSKPLKHNDSLSKKKGKQMIKNFLNATDEYQKYSNPVNIKQSVVPVSETLYTPLLIDQQEPDEKLVEKWKTFWDSKLEIEKETEGSHWKPKPSQKVEFPKTVQNIGFSIQENNITMADIVESPSKQDIPEEVFIAFETSPKRFFGTSRKQIINKIDTFLGKPTTNKIFTSEISMVGRETGLVSSRISLFHKISNTEPLPWSYRKCQSLYNLTQQKYSDTNMALEETHLVNKSFQNVSETNADKSQNYNMVQNTNSSMQDIRLSDKDEYETIEQSHSFDVSKSQSPDQSNVEKKKNSVKMAVKEFNEYNQPDYRFQKSKLNTSISKSEMDIFNKVSNKSSEEDLDKHKSYEELPKINVKNFISLYESVSKSSLESNSPQHYKKNHIGTQKQLASSDSGTPEIIKTIKQKSLAEQLSLSTTASDSNSSSNSQKTAISRNISPESLSDSIEIEVISNQDQDCTYFSLSDIELEIVEKNQEVFVTPETSPERSFETENIEYKDRFQFAKQYFQSLEELREQKTTKKLNECEMLLYGVNESPKNNNANRQPGRVKKNLKQTHYLLQK